MRDQSRIVRMCQAVYRVLLYAYPRQHRREYGWLMMQLLSDQVRSALALTGGRGLFGLGLRTLADTARGSISEHLNALGGTMILAARPVAPLPWGAVVLAVMPFVLAVIGIRQREFMLFAAAVIALEGLWGAAVWRSRRAFPAWALGPAGCALSMTLIAFYGGISRLVPFGIGPWGGETTIAVMYVAMTGVLLVALALLVRPQFRQPHGWGTPALLALIMLFATSHTLVSGLTPEGLDWPMISSQAAVLPIFVALLLLPVGIASRVALRHQQLATLFVLGAYYPLVSIALIDSERYFVTPWQLEVALMLTSAALLFIVAPALVARARSHRGRTLGAVIPAAGALVMGALIPAVLSGGDHPAFLARSVAGAGLEAALVLVGLLLAVQLSVRGGATTQVDRSALDQEEDVSLRLA